jgi:hypothetical protein
MAQIETSLYQTIADNYSSLQDSLSLVQGYAQTALYSIVDITTSYGDPSGDAAAALEIELALLNPYNAAYIQSGNLTGSISIILDAVRAINNFVIANSSTSGTAAVKLNTWINTTMPWANVPSGWKDLCDYAGYDVSTWT